MFSRVFSSMFAAVFCLVILSPAAHAQWGGSDDYPMCPGETGDIYECVNHCESYCSAEESTGGMFLSEKKIEDLVLDECDCAEGLAKFKKCTKKILDAFKPAVKLLGAMDRIDDGVNVQLAIKRREWIDDCKAELQLQQR